MKNDYKGLDALAASLKAKGYDIRQDNKTEIDGFYEGLKVSDEDSDQSQQNRLELLQEWVASNSDSLSAHITIALWYTLANLGSSAETAAESLNSVPAGTPIDDSVYFDVWIKICLMQGRPKEDMFGYLNRCIAMAKEYEPIYLDARHYLSEQWHGEHGEREKWMKVWADSFPPEKGDLLYAFLLSSDARNIGEGIFKLDVDYNRARNALVKRIAQNDPAWVHDETVLSYLAVVKNDSPLVKKTLFDLEGIVDTSFYSSGSDDGSEYYRDLRRNYGVYQGFDHAMALERSGNLAEAEKLLRSFTFHPATYLPLASFFERQGMRDSLMSMNYMMAGKPIKEVISTDISSASPEYLAELAPYYAMMRD